ncbi:MAG: Nramp family divalent metal transporter [Abditibacteriales bacterium]|nr:Nramp family divalent metal transporter [Abditibacteriales bacterium]
MAQDRGAKEGGAIREPPTRFGEMLRCIGPGIVVSGSVIGSGELINTPKQAAQFGFALLWAVIISCVIKYWLQVELGRHALVHGRTTIQALNLVPGPKVRGTGWVGVLYFVGYICSMATLVGIFGATAGLLQSCFPTLSYQMWAVVTFVVTALILYRGIYRQLESFVTLLVAGFSLSVLVSVILVQGTPYRVHLRDVGEGLSFRLPEGAAYAAISLMGALGMTANELFMYPYWVLEKGYARFVGAAQGDEVGWLRRARGWVNVMRLDAAIATAIATVVTLAYFLMGAAILHPVFLQTRQLPANEDVVRDVSRIFTESYGRWSYWLFMFGGFCTLYSTLVVVASATGRMFTDLLCCMGCADWHDDRARGKLVRGFTVGFLFLLFVLATCFPRRPDALVVFGQFANGIFNTPLIIIGILTMAWQTDRRLRMGTISTCLLLVSVAVIGVYLAWSVPSVAKQLFGVQA